MNYNIQKPWLTLDDWQKEYIGEKGNCFLLCGRQVGKSAAMSIKFGKRAAEIPNKSILMIAYTEKQAYALFFKTLMYLEAVYPNRIIKKGREKPTKHIITLKNGSKIMCYAAGEAGLGLRGFTITDLVIDEAAAMSKELFAAVSPMISVTKGTIDMSSTPRGKAGFFYECSKREDFKKFYVSAETCPRHTKEFLDGEKMHLSRLEYAQEYLAVFLDELKRLFPDDLIKEVCILKRRERVLQHHNYFMGCDIARLGGDESTWEIIDGTNKDNFEQVENIVERKTLITQVAAKIVELELIYKFNKIGIDDRAVGAGVFDILLDESSTKRKIVGLDNAKRSLDNKDKRTTRLLKEDMYLFLLSLLEQKKLKLLDDDDIKASLASIQYEYIIGEGKNTRFRIFGSYSHICEGLIRACYLIKNKSLNIWAY